MPKRDQRRGGTAHLRVLLVGSAHPTNVETLYATSLQLSISVFTELVK